MENNKVDLNDVDDVLDSGIHSEGNLNELDILYNKLGMLCIEYGHTVCAISTNSRVQNETLEETKQKADELLIQIKSLQKRIDELNSKTNSVVDISTHRKFKGAKQPKLSDNTPNIVA